MANAHGRGKGQGHGRTAHPQSPTGCRGAGTIIVNCHEASLTNSPTLVEAPRPPAERPLAGGARTLTGRDRHLGLSSAFHRPSAPSPPAHHPRPGGPMLASLRAPCLVRPLRHSARAPASRTGTSLHATAMQQQVMGHGGPRRRARRTRGPPPRTACAAPSSSGACLAFTRALVR